MCRIWACFKDASYTALSSIARLYSVSFSERSIMNSWPMEARARSKQWVLAIALSSSGREHLRWSMAWSEVSHYFPKPLIAGSHDHRLNTQRGPGIYLGHNSLYVIWSFCGAIIDADIGWVNQDDISLYRWSAHDRKGIRGKVSQSRKQDKGQQITLHISAWFSVYPSFLLPVDAARYCGAANFVLGLNITQADICLISGGLIVTRYHFPIITESSQRTPLHIPITWESERLPTLSW